MLVRISPHFGSVHILKTPRSRQRSETHRAYGRMPCVSTHLRNAKGGCVGGLKRKVLVLNGPNRPKRPKNGRYQAYRGHCGGGYGLGEAPPCYTNHPQSPLASVPKLLFSLLYDLAPQSRRTDDLVETGAWMKKFSSAAGVPYINRKLRASGFQRRIVRLQQRSSCLHFARLLFSTVAYFTMGDW